MARNNLLTYPDSNEAFENHINASMFELGAVIIQKGKPITLYNRKLTDNQQQHTVTERELLSIAETLKEYITILLGNKLRIYNNHKNPTCENFITDRVLTRRLILEEYGPHI